MKPICICRVCCTVLLVLYFSTELACFVFTITEAQNRGAHGTGALPEEVLLLMTHYQHEKLSLMRERCLKS